MFGDINLLLILVTAFVASASPGPATLAIASASMTSGRKKGLILASGVTTGSLMWSVSAAFGLGAVMLANAWAFEVIRYFGACYLLYLAFKSLRSAISPADDAPQAASDGAARSAFSRGLALHLTNPKAILFFGSLFSVGVPSNSPPEALLIVIVAVGIQSFIVFHGYALLFSSRPMSSAYGKLKRWFEVCSQSYLAARDLNF